MSRLHAPSILALLAALGAAACGGDDPSLPQLTPITIGTSSLPGGQVGVPYSATLAATGGQPESYGWSVTTGALPAGLALSTAGRLSGTPTAAGTYDFEVQVVDAQSGSARRSLTLVIAAVDVEPLTIETGTLPDATRGAAYTSAITASGGAGYAWSLASGALPPGLTLAASGTPSTTLAGTATATGTFTFTVRVAAEDGRTAERELTLRVLAAPQPLTIDTTALPSGTIGTAYTTQLASRGGSGAPLTWSITAGALPAGLALATDGRISGTPTSTGTARFTVQVTDGVDAPTAALSITVASVGPPLTILTVTLPAGRAGDAYQAELSGTGGSNGGFAWSVVAGALPPGLALEAMGTPSTNIAGTPTQAGDFSFTVALVDGVGQRSTRAFRIAVAPEFVPIRVVSASVPLGEVGVAYQGSVTAADGTGAGYGWLVTGGALPTGLALSPNGTPTAQITGTPIVAGTFTATVTVFDSNNQTATRSITIEIAGPLVPLAITTATLPNAGLGEAYAQTVTATAGSAAGYVWSVVQGALPPGLTLGAAGTPSTQITGAPTVSGDYDFTVQVTDSNGGTATRALRISVGTALIITTATLAPARLNEPYAAVITALGGNSTGFTWRVTQGTLPPGLTLAASGTPSTTLAGTPTAGGIYEFTIEVRDSASTVALRAFRMVVSGAQRFAAWVGDTAVDNDVGVFVVDLSGPTPGPQIMVSPSAPGTGDAPTSANYTQFSPDNTRLAFRGDFMTDTVEELWVVDLTGPQPAPPQRVNGAMIALDDVGAFSWSPDGRFITYQADGDADAVIDQYVVDVSGAVPGPAMRVSGAMVNGGDVGVDDFGWSPDSNRLFYVADQEIDNVFYIYVSTLTAGAFPVATRVNQDLPAASDVDPAGAAFTGDSARILYTADATVGVEELWMVDLSGATPGAPVSLAAPIQAAGDVVPAQTDVSPDGVWVSFVADRVTEGANELWLVDVSGPTPSAPVRISDALVSGRGVLFASWSPDSTRLLYLADRDIDEVDELFMVGVGGVAPVTPVKVNPSLPANRLVVNNDSNGFLWSPDGSRVAYRADPNVDGDYELFVAPVDETGPGPAVLVSVPNPVDLVSNMFFSPDSQRIAWRGPTTVVGRVELYMADISGPVPGPPVPLAIPSIAAGAVSTAFFWFGNDRIVFSGDLAVDSETNAYVVDVTQTPAVPVQLNPALPTNGDVSTLFAQRP